MGHPTWQGLGDEQQSCWGCRGLCARAKLIGGALSFGATLLNPENSVEDLQKEFIQIQQESNRKNSEELSGLKDVMNKTFLVAVDTRFKVGCNLCCLCAESFLKMK